MNILITGIHGFVGSNLVARIKQHHTISGLDIVSIQKDEIIKTYNWNELEQCLRLTVFFIWLAKNPLAKITQKKSYFDILTD